MTILPESIITLSTERAYSLKTIGELRKAKWIFSLFQHEKLMRFFIWSTRLLLSIRFPVKWFIRPMIFKHFCGGETLDECVRITRKLYSAGVKSIPDFSAEGNATPKAFMRVKDEVLQAIRMAAAEPSVLFAVFKPTGLSSIELWEKLSSDEILSSVETEQKKKLEGYLEEIFKEASASGVPVLVDAEETWIQPAIDSYIRIYSEKYNRDKVLVYNTVQMYRTDRLEFIRRELERAVSKGYRLGYKVVRGAYHEKEQLRAGEMNYPSPVFSHKEDTDEAYNAALAYCFEHRKNIALCAATHNEHSTLLLARLLLENSDEHKLPVTFAQLYGMSDHLTFNLAAAGFTAAKYLPYGPVKEVLPYLIRRAEENRSVTGETGRELLYIRQELTRRRA